MLDAAAAGDENEFAQHDLRSARPDPRAAGQPRARAIVRSLRETTRLLGASTADRTRTLADIDAEHAPIIEAIIAGDPAEAADSMRAHLVNTGRLLVRQALGDDADETVDEIWSAVVEPDATAGSGAP